MLGNDYRVWYEQAAAMYPLMLAVGMDPLAEFPDAVSIVFLMVWRHVTRGTPLHLTDALIDAWRRNGGDVRICRECGYVLPEEFTRCVLCNCGLFSVWEMEQVQACRVNGWKN